MGRLYTCMRTTLISVIYTSHYHRNTENLAFLYKNSIISAPGRPKTKIMCTELPKYEDQSLEDIIYMAYTQKQNLLGHRKIWFGLQPTENDSSNRCICCLERQICCHHRFVGRGNRKICSENRFRWVGPQILFFGVDIYTKKSRKLLPSIESICVANIVCRYQ
jgi:hypothetical protein